MNQQIKQINVENQIYDIVVSKNYFESDPKATGYIDGRTHYCEYAAAPSKFSELNSAEQGTYTAYYFPVPSGSQIFLLKGYYYDNGEVVGADLVSATKSLLFTRAEMETLNWTQTLVKLNTSTISQDGGGINRRSPTPTVNLIVSYDRTANNLVFKVPTTDLAYLEKDTTTIGIAKVQQIPAAYIPGGVGSSATVAPIEGLEDTYRLYL